MATLSAVERKSLNTQRLKRVSPSIRPNVQAVLKEMEAAGYQPIIDADVWRSPAEQAQKVQQGYSKVSYSYHNVTTVKGEPDSLAVDVVDARWYWKAPRSYWVRLAGAAERQGLTTGIYWGLSTGQRKAIHKAIANGDWDAKVTLGWDTAHIEPADFSISRAKAGERPKLPKPKPPAEPPKPKLLINDVPIDNAYFVPGPNGITWYAAEGEVMNVFGKASPTPDLAQPVRAVIEKSGYKITRTTNRLAERNRFDIRAERS